MAMNKLTELFIKKRAALWRFLGNSPGPSDKYEMERWERGQRLYRHGYKLTDSSEDKIFLALLERGAAPSGKYAKMAWMDLRTTIMENRQGIIPLVMSERLTEHEAMDLDCVLRELRITGTDKTSFWRMTK